MHLPNSNFMKWRAIECLKPNFLVKEIPAELMFAKVSSGTWELHTARVFTAMWEFIVVVLCNCVHYNTLLKVKKAEHKNR